MKKILITGASGRIGQKAVQHFLKVGYEVLGIDITQKNDITKLDLGDQAALKQYIKLNEPHVIIHLAAISNIEYCELHPEQSEAQNFQNTINLVHVCNEFNAFLLFFSTNVVFESSSKKWCENDITKPESQYGKDKEACEKYISAHLKYYAIIRTSQVYNIKDDFPAFIKHNLEKIGEVKVYQNLYTNFTNVIDLMNMLGIIIHNNMSGIYHCVGQDVYSKYEFAKKFVDALKITGKVTAIDCTDVKPKHVILEGSHTYNKLNYYPKFFFNNNP